MAILGLIMLIKGMLIKLGSAVVDDGRMRYYKKKTSTKCCPCLDAGKSKQLFLRAPPMAVPIFMGCIFHKE